MSSHEQDNCARNPETERTALIPKLNDKLRCDHQGGQLFVTSGISELKSGMMPQIIDAVTKFDDFTKDNDPHGEHDFGMVIVLGHKVFWKIDYYDAKLEYGSPDPADASVTSRVLTVMLAHEY
tara:strand:+ start:22731 stop:23099 length:369 start_codon:yes stop_codon:yes gene_type:complete